MFKLIRIGNKPIKQHYLCTIKVNNITDVIEILASKFVKYEEFISVMRYMYKTQNIKIESTVRHEVEVYEWGKLTQNTKDGKKRLWLDLNPNPESTYPIAFRIQSKKMKVKSSKEKRSTKKIIEKRNTDGIKS